MIIFWKGWGILVVIIAMVFVAIFQLTANGITGNPHYGDTHNWLNVLALAIAGIPIYLIGRYFNSQPGRVVIDKATKREVVLRRTHSLLFIPMEYWAFILPAIGLLLSFTDTHQN